MGDNLMMACMEIFPTVEKMLRWLYGFDGVLRTPQFMDKQKNGIDQTWRE